MSDALLKPCPFCGNEARFGIVEEGGEANPDFGGHYVQCISDKCHGCMGLRFACGDDPRPGLSEAWNKRVYSTPRCSNDWHSAPYDETDNRCPDCGMKA